jgi:transcriptional regulator GlxA family with amidase domain
MELVIVPGGRGARALVGAEPTRTWLRQLHKEGVLVTSVCTGALVLAGAGLLRDRPAAT